MNKKPLGPIAALIFAGVGATDATASSITTLFESNNFGFGNMFDVTTFDSAVTITALDVNVTGSGLIPVSLYIRSGTYIGNESNSAGWTLIDTIDVAAAGLDSATMVDLADFILPAGTLTGFYVAIGTMQGDQRIAYTSGTAAYDNEDLQLDLGAGTIGLFVPVAIGPRIWNGTIYYDRVTAASEPGSLALIGMGLAGLGLSLRRKVA